MTHGYRTEDLLEKICDNIFQKDFVYRSPVLVEESGEKELTDILVILDDTILIIQSKSIEASVDDVLAKNPGRLTKRYTKAKQQINTSLNAHKRNAKVKVISPLDFDFEIDWSTITTKIGIVCINIPDDKYEDPEFRFTFPYKYEQHRDIDVHTFLLRDLYEISKEYKTPGDFLKYLSDRKDMISSNKFILESDLDFIGFIKTNFPDYQKFLSDSNLSGIVLAPGYWEKYREEFSDEIKKRNDAFKKNQIVKLIIREFINSIEYSIKKYNHSKQLAVNAYLKITGVLGKLSEIERHSLVTIIESKRNQTKTKSIGYSILSCANNTATIIILVDNNDNREARINFLKVLAEDAVFIINTQTLIGFALEGYQSVNHGIDCVIFDVEFMKKELRKLHFTPKGFFGPSKKHTSNEWDYVQ